MNTQALITFVKNPKLGKVKTRLARTMGDEAALRVYQELLRHTRELAARVDASRYVYYSDEIPGPDEWSDAGFHQKLQPVGDLGHRMETAFREAFEVHERTVIIGSDCATLSTDIVAEALRELQHKDFVIGPALDGGYYLLGMSTFTPALFHGVAWSTDQVFPITLKKIQESQGSYRILPTLSDIDYEEDWNTYGWEID